MSLGTNMQDSLSDYGHAFQSKVIAILLSDKAFLQQVSDIIEPYYFESQANSWLIEKILSYHNTYKDTPTGDVLKSEILSIDDSLLKTSVIKSLTDIKTNKNSTDVEYIKNALLNFCKNQKMKGAILDSVDLLKSGNFDLIKKKIDTAIKAGADKDIGHEYKIQIDARYEEGSRDCIPTGWGVIDDVMNGGLAAGELGIIVAPAGIGKSWGLVSIAANAVKAGKTVVYYTLELNQFYVARRFDAFYTKIPFQNLNEDHAQEKIKETVANLKGELILKYYPTKSASVTTIGSHIEKCISQGKKPDLIIIDYADLIKPSKAGDKRLELNDIYEDLRGLAGLYEIPCWSASQANRSSLEDDIIEGGKVSESYNKLMIADFVMSLSRKVNDKIGGTGRFHTIKNRFGPDGMTFPSKINTMNGNIEIYEPNSDMGKSVTVSMQGDPFAKKLMNTRLKELGGIENLETVNKFDSF
jgi:replicative DNA helicase